MTAWKKAELGTIFYVDSIRDVWYIWSIPTPPLSTSLPSKLWDIHQGHTHTSSIPAPRLRGKYNQFFWGRTMKMLKVIENTGLNWWGRQLKVKVFDQPVFLKTKLKHAKSKVHANHLNQISKRLRSSYCNIFGHHARKRAWSNCSCLVPLGFLKSMLPKDLEDKGAIKLRDTTWVPR